MHKLAPHLMMAGACVVWGLMSPLGKHAMTHGIDGFTMVFLRVSGAALCFWITSLLTTSSATEKVDIQEIGLFALAAIFGITCNQCCFTIGLSKTSPIHASILTTTLPIFALLIGAVFFGRKVTWRKAIGIATGMVGAVILILGSAGRVSLGDKFGGAGDLLVIGAQCSFAIYMNVFQGLLKRHSIITLQKWMMTFATLYVLPMARPHLMATDWLALSPRVVTEALFVVVCGTYIAYIMMTWAQQRLQPTSIAMYNYVQPLVACIVSVWLGVGYFGPMQMMAVVLVFSGVWLVTQKS